MLIMQLKYEKQFAMMIWFRGLILDILLPSLYPDIVSQPSLTLGASLSAPNQTVKLHLLLFRHFHLPSLYPDTLGKPSVTLGVPLRAPNQPKRHPRNEANKRQEHPS